MPFKLSKLSPGGDKWEKQAHLDHLHLFIAEEFVAEEVADQFNAGKTTKRIHVDFVVCVDDREMWSDLMVYGAQLVPRLDGCDPPVAPGRLGQGLPGKDGKSPAWLLDDPTDADLATAERFLSKYATTLPSGGVVLDVKAILLARDNDEPF